MKKEELRKQLKKMKKEDLIENLASFIDLAENSKFPTEAYSQGWRDSRETLLEIAPDEELRSIIIDIYEL